MSEPQGRRHLAVAAPNWVGDLVMATPVLEAALASPFFERTTILCRAHLAPLLRGGPLEPHVRPHGPGEETALYCGLAPDAVLLLSSSFGAAWRAWRARVPLRAGSALSGRRFLLTHAVIPAMEGGRRLPIPTAHLLRDVAGLLGIAPVSLHPRLYASAALREAQARELASLGLEPGAGYAVCCPGAAFGSAKLWAPERFARALDELRERNGLRGLVTGGPGEEALIDAVAGASRTGAISLASRPRSLESLKALIAGARIVLSLDSGPRWVAAAFDVPCVTVMGPNVPELTASSLELCEVVRLEDLECSPCARRTCPLGHHRCMLGIGPERVVAAAERLLARCEPVPAGAGVP